jgi:hypothetical protein
MHVVEDIVLDLLQLVGDDESGFVALDTIDHEVDDLALDEDDNDGMEDYTMKEIFAVFEDLKDEKFQIKKEEDKFKFSILIKILNKEKTLTIDINEVTQSEDDLIKYLIKTLKSQEDRITKLENELNELKKSKQ